jgi:import inner membrane translocase subunit TIM8
MDPSSLGLGNFNEKDRREIQQLIQNEQQKAKFQESPRSSFLGLLFDSTNNWEIDVHSLTGMCWTKCIASNKLTSPEISKTEAACLDNCVNRFIDTQKAVISQVEKMGGH